jgi:hypothetical protein
MPFAQVWTAYSNEAEFKREFQGTGDTVDVFLVYSDYAYRIILGEIGNPVI